MPLIHTTSIMMISPLVVISGGGPAGLLLGTLLSMLGVSVTIFEKSVVSDPWSSRSYSINLNSRGLSALDHAGVLDEVQKVGMPRRRVVLEEEVAVESSFDDVDDDDCGSKTNNKRSIIPVDPPSYALCRPDLVDCLEGIVKKMDRLCGDQQRVTIRRGVTVSMVAENEENDTIEISLDDGSTLTCTHLVGADGKWSTVRQSCPRWKDMFSVQSEPIFGISITPSLTPKRWEMDAFSIFRPKSPKYYIIASPLVSGNFHVSMICVDEIKEEHPWLVPRGRYSGGDNLDWEAEYGALTADSRASSHFVERLSEMLKKELPQFYKDVRGFESLKESSIRINRRVSWLKPMVDNPSYCSESGRIALIGDAAHAMTPKLGQGCNCALESAVSLVRSLRKDKPVTVEDLTKAFKEYGARRPSEVIPIQKQSAG